MGQSWSGIKRRLEQDLLCEKLRGRVRYFITKYRKSHDEESRIAILIDEKEVIRGNINDQPEWLKQFYELRLDVENIHFER